MFQVAGRPTPFHGTRYRVSLVARGTPETVLSSEVIESPLPGETLRLTVPVKRAGYLGLLAVRVEALTVGAGDAPATMVATVRMRKES